MKKIESPAQSFAEALTPQATQRVAAFGKMSGIVVIHESPRHQTRRRLNGSSRATSRNPPPFRFPDR